MSEISSTYHTLPADTPAGFPAQHQDTQPGIQQAMNPVPVTDNPAYRGTGKLENRLAVITGGDSGIGQAVASAFAKEGADIVVAYLSEQEDAQKTAELVQAVGRRCVLVQCDLREESGAQQVVETAMREIGHIDILVNNIAVQYPQISAHSSFTIPLQRIF